MARYVEGGTGNKTSGVNTADLNINLPNNQVVTLAGQGVGGTATVAGVIAWEEMF